ncbi:hypothetical protein SDJN02_10685, partial [Cucurbita argyrosperma subsp. argyrosperma]
MKNQKSKMAKRETENTVTVEEKGLDGIDQIVGIAGGKQLGFGDDEKDSFCTKLLLESEVNAAAGKCTAAAVERQSRSRMEKLGDTS